MVQDVGASADADRALVNEAPAGLRPSGFDPSRGYEQFPLPDWCVGRVPTISRERAVHADTLRKLVERLDLAGEREVADTIVWLMWWRKLADNRAQWFIDMYFARGPR